MDKTKLLAERAVTTRDVDLPNGMGTVTVKALTRGEVMTANEAAKGKSDAAREIHIIAAAMVNPTMTTQEVAQWLKVAPAGESVAVTDAIRDLSGLSEGAQKSGV